MRNSCIIYRSFFEAIRVLPKEEQADLWNAIFDFALNFKEPEISGLSQSIFTLIRPNIEANIKRYHSGNKAKHKQSISKPKAKHKQTQSKAEADADKDVDVDADVDVDVDVDANALFEKIKIFFGLTEEIHHINKWQRINGFLNELHKTNKTAYFEKQFNNYQKYKIETNEKIHGFESFIAGGWDAENWEYKLIKETPILKI